MRNPPSHTRPTVGVILDNVTGDSRSSLWPGIADTIREQGGNLLCFTGGYLRDPDNFTTRGNIVYEMIDRDRLDGLIIWASSLSSYVTHESIQKFCERYRPLPIVSIGMILDGIPSVVLDSYQGLREVVDHLISVHGRRRIAFIRGPEGHRDADARYRAYLDAMNESGLPLAPGLISLPYKWFEPGGKLFMHELLDQRPTDFDAVVTVTDEMAVEAIESLSAHGIRVPEDVCVTGFNNKPIARVVTPPLTTVPWHMYERGRQAATLLLSMLEGKPAPMQVVLPAHMIIRQSCGCLDPTVIQAGSDRPSSPIQVESNGTIPRTPQRPERQECLAAIEQIIEEKDKSGEWIGEFLDAFFDELQGRATGVFLPTLERILRQEVAIGGNITAWQEAISALRQQLLPVLTGNQGEMIRAEDLWHQARVMIGERARRARGFRELQARQQTERLRRISHGLATMATVPDLMTVLAEELPRLNISRCYLGLYEDPARSTEWCRLVLAYDENGRLDLGADGRRVLSRQLAMGDLLPPDKPYSMLVEPLHFEDEQLGLILFAQQPSGDIYEVLRDEISITLKAVMLGAQNVRLYEQALAAERDAQEGRRLAEEADRLKSYFLSMVSHELLTPLVLLVGLSEMMLHVGDPDQGGKGSGHRPPLPEPYRADLARIHLSAQQLGNLVRDVLDLTRSQMGQLKLAKKPIDLCEMLQAVALVGEQMAHSKGLEWQVDIPEHLPRVYGDASRLQQVTLNLVANAVKFTTEGHVKIRVDAAADTVTVAVSDTGPGVPQGEQEAIFDEFRQSERTASRGYGGLGIGLAICRQLVELHGGQIGVHSSGEEESGSTFYFTLPVLPDQTLDDPDPKPNSGTVLLLTERATGDARLYEYLKREGFQVTSLDTDETANWMERVVALAPGAVVLGCQPASEHGWQLIETLKDNAATQNIPVLFYSLQEQGAGAMLALDYMSKPMGTTALAQALRRYGLGADKCTDSRLILVVDDDPNILEMHRQVVQNALPDCRVLQAANGRIALDLMQHETPSLVLLDLMMPELDGLGVLAAMQENERLRGIPAIVLTAQVLTQQEMSRLNRGVAAVLGKGIFTVQETLAQIEQALTRNKRLGSETLRMVNQVMAFIHEHYAEPISREDMAAQVGVSPRHLTRCFHQEAGISPITYLNRYRVMQARQLLEAGDKNITEIAAAVGFSSSNYFTDAFRREMGVSPREYQRGKRTNPSYWC